MHDVLFVGGGSAGGVLVRAHTHATTLAMAELMAGRVIVEG